MKKLLSIALSLLIVLGAVPAFADNTAATTPASIDKASKEYTNPIADQLLTESATYDTSVFEGAPGYILQDTFANVSGVDKLGVPSGWDVDKRGGTITGNENSLMKIKDTDKNYAVSMTKELMAHKSGKITFETSFKAMYKAESDYSYTLSGNGKTAFKLVTEKDKLAVLKPDGTTESVATYQKDIFIPVKAILDLDKKTVEVSVGGTLCGTYPFAEDAAQIDRITISTGKETTMSVWLRYVYLYFGYAVNENFMTAYPGTVPYDWKRENGGTTSSVVEDNNQVYPDTYSFAIDDATTVDNVSLSKPFEDISGKVVFESRFIVPKKGDFELYIGNGKQKAITVKAVGNDLVMGNGTVLRANYRENFWYTLKVMLDTATKKADIYLNYNKVLSDVPFETNVNSLNNIHYETQIKKITQMRIDDIYVYNHVVPSDYVPKPEPVKPEGDLEIGMQMYSMWNEGNHFGWDWITAYPDRIPYLGLYAEGKPEVADWVTKWQTEHGFTFRTEIFSRAPQNLNQPIKLPTRYHAMYNGYFNSEYKNDIKFAVMWSGISTSTFGGMEDFKNNFVPHFVENFFSHPNYLTKDNKAVMFMYNPIAFVNAIGGMDKANEALAYLEEECKKIGYDGFILVADGSIGGFMFSAKELGHGYTYAYGMNYDSRNSKTQLKVNDTYFATGANVVGSIPMGWGRNPWAEKNEGEIFSTPEDTKNTILGLKERFAKTQNPTNMIILTCWDEYGEGHFYAPTRVQGFGYLNAVRDAVTNLGPKTEEAMPTAKAMARMDSLYLGSRRALKLVVERGAPVFLEDSVDRTKLQVIAEWDFEKMGNIGEWKEYQDVTNLRYENGALRGNSTARDPGVWIEGINIPASDVKMVRITTETAGAGKGQIYYQTDVDPDMGVNGKRFDVMQNTSEMKEHEAFAFNAEKLQGNITAIRWDPRDDGFPAYTDFAVKKIQILGYPDESIKLADSIVLTYNGNELKITRPPFTKDGVLYFAPNRPFLEMNFKTTWDYSSGTYVVEVDDKRAELTVGSNVMKVNGQDVNLGGVAYYEDGNLFTPLRPLMEALGVTVSWNGEKNAIELLKAGPVDDYNYQEEVDASKPFSWMFETKQTEGWTVNDHAAPLKMTRGTLLLECAGTDPFIYSPNISLDASEYKYMRVRMMNETAETKAYLFFTTTDSKSFGGGKRIDFTVSANDTEMKEYIVPLYGADLWKGTITQLRFDPANAAEGLVYFEGNVYIDSIEFLKELPQ